MFEPNFLVFCITIVALTAIVFGKDNIVRDALSSLTNINQRIVNMVLKLRRD